MDRRWLLATAVALTAVLGGMWWGRGIRPPSVAPSGPAREASVVATTAPDLLVHVSGWVESPGLVSVGPGARVGDVLAAAGGALPGARLEELNLAGMVADGEQLVVPGPGGSTPERQSVPEAPDGHAGPIHLNSASAAELETLPGVGPVLAERIVSHRQSQGDFSEVEDLLDVSGIGEAKLGSIRDLVAVP